MTKKVWIVLEAYDDANDWHISGVYDSILKADDAKEKLVAEGVRDVDVQEYEIQ